MILSLPNHRFNSILYIQFILVICMSNSFFLFKLSLLTQPQSLWYLLCFLVWKYIPVHNKHFLSQIDLFTDFWTPPIYFNPNVIQQWFFSNQNKKIQNDWGKRYSDFHKTILSANSSLYLKSCFRGNKFTWVTLLQNHTDFHTGKMSW